MLTHTVILAAFQELSDELGYPSPTGNFQPVETIDLPNLRVQAPTPEYVLTMKVLAARAAVRSDRGDANDIAHLIRLLGLRDSKAVMDIVTRFYDPSRLLPRLLYLVDEIV